MAPFNAGGNKYSEFEKIAIAEFYRAQNTPIYCTICGREILNYAGSEEAINNTAIEKKNKAHTECVRARNQELAEKAAAEERARIEAIIKAREEEARKNGGQR